jgi:5'-3' exonuclease
MLAPVRSGFVGVRIPSGCELDEPFCRPLVDRQPDRPGARVSEDLEEPLAGDLDRPEPFEVRGDQLHIKQASACFAQSHHGLEQRDLRSVVPAVEHRLPGEDPTYLDPVQATDELVSFPDLDAVGPTQAMQAHVRPPEFGGDPGPDLVWPVRTCGDDLVEGGVDGRGPPARAQPRAETTWHVDAIQRDDAPRIGAEPGQRDTGVGPREDAPTVGVDQCRRIQIGADTDHAVLVCLIRGGEHPGRRRERLRWAGQRWPTTRRTPADAPSAGTVALLGARAVASDLHRVLLHRAGLSVPRPPCRAPVPGLRPEGADEASVRGTPDAEADVEAHVRLHLIDGTFELFRAHYSKRPSRRDLEGNDIKATVGVVGSLLALLDDDQERPTHLAVAFDNPIESFRNRMFAGYKDGSEVDPDLLAQFDGVEAAVRALGVTVWSMDEHEADDALATAAVRFADEVDQVRILTPDKDLGQVVNGTRIVQVDRMRDRVIDEAAILERRGVPPTSIPDLLALVGDTADGIPGLPGFGEKTTATLLAHYGTVDAIPDDPSDWAVKVRGADRLAETLRSRRDDVDLYRRLAVLVTDVPLPDDLDDLAWAGVPREPFLAWCEASGVDTLRERPSRWA